MSTSYRIIASVVLYSSVVLRPAEVERESAQDSYMPEPLSCVLWRARSNEVNKSKLDREELYEMTVKEGPVRFSYSLFL